MRLAVHLQREIARLHHYDSSQSNRALASALGISPNTVGAMRAVLEKCARPWSELESLDDNAWKQTLGTDNRSIAQRKEAPDWEHVHREMQRDDATLEQLWREWREQCPDGIGYSRFAEGYRAWAKKLHIVMRRVHRLGEKLFVDFAGRTVEVKDPNGGPSILAQVFVAVLGYSNYTYVQAVASQTTADWLKCHIDCFAALGGVPEWVVPDNLKAAVLRRERDRIVINPAFRECLRHYSTAAQPTGVRKPKHKPKAEVGVQIAQRWILFALRDRTFFSLDELNAELRLHTAKMNNHAFKKMPGTRQERFTVEQETLKPLPEKPFELCDWRYGVRVSDDYHIEHLRTFYSVPHQMRSEKVDLRFTRSLLEIMQHNRRVATHAISAIVGSVNTLEEHRPVVHSRVLDGEPRALIDWARSVGASTAQMICHHLQDRADATNGLRAARRMRDFARTYGDQRFEEACAYALPLNITALRSIESILKQSPDKVEKPATTTEAKKVHEYVRGENYYGESNDE